jgi:altronate hydrolase
MQYIKIHSLDNVASRWRICRRYGVTIDNESVTLRQAISRGHKFALRLLRKGKTS